MSEPGFKARQQIGRWTNNRVENSNAPLPTTRTGYAQVQTDEDAPKVRFSPCLASQPLQPKTPSHRQTYLQGATLGSAGRVEPFSGLRIRNLLPTYACRRQVRVGLTAPPVPQYRDRLPLAMIRCARARRSLRASLPKCANAPRRIPLCGRQASQDRTAPKTEH